MSEVRQKTLWSNTSVSAGGSIESLPIRLGPGPTGVSSLWAVKSGGIMTLQPKVTSGTFTFTVYFSNFPDADVWDSGTVIATDVDSSKTDRITINPNGPALWMKIKATETGGSGSPVLSTSLCTD